jgi:L-ascorbate metabolism protein UlaG (beta-lactamase superfamily)
VDLHFLRHATLVLELNGTRLLVDPMFSRAAELDPVPNAQSAARIPLVELPLAQPELTALLQGIDAVLVTHTHRDHWDAAAVALLPKDLPIFCQPEDAPTIGAQGFTAIQPIQDTEQWQGLRLHRTKGQHGTGAIGERMGPVSGFVIEAEQEPTVYLAGDTIWCQAVETALNQYRPAITIVNAGAAQFLAGDPITMTAADVVKVCRALPSTRVVAVHMEAINHCLLSRSDLARHLSHAHLLSQVQLPADGERLLFA